MQYVDAEKPPWTTDNFLKAVQAVYDSGKTDVGAIYCSGQGGDQGTRAIINNMYGGTFTDAAHTKYTADSAENVKAIETLYNQDGINFDASINGGEELTLFRNGTPADGFLLEHCPADQQRQQRGRHHQQRRRHPVHGVPD